MKHLPYEEAGRVSLQDGGVLTVYLTGSATHPLYYRATSPHGRLRGQFYLALQDLTKVVDLTEESGRRVLSRLT